MKWDVLILRVIKRELKRLLPTNVDPRIAYTGTKLGSCFHIKDKTKIEHQHDLVYEVGCPNPTCNKKRIETTVTNQCRSTNCLYWYKTWILFPY